MISLYRPCLWTEYTNRVHQHDIPAMSMNSINWPCLWTLYTCHVYEHYIPAMSMNSIYRPCLWMQYYIPTTFINSIYRTFLWTVYTEHVHKTLHTDHVYEQYIPYMSMNSICDHVYEQYITNLSMNRYIPNRRNMPMNSIYRTYLWTLNNLYQTCPATICVVKIFPIVTVKVNDPCVGFLDILIDY